MALIYVYLQEIPNSGDLRIWLAIIRDPYEIKHHYQDPVFKQPRMTQWKVGWFFFRLAKDLQAMIGPLKNALSDQRLKAKALVEVGPGALEEGEDISPYCV